MAALAAQSLQGRVVVVMRVNAPNLEQGLSLVVSVRELYLLWPALVLLVFWELKIELVWEGVSFVHALVGPQANLALARGIKL